VPTTKEEGYGDVIGSAWNGIAAPAGTPQDIVTKLNSEISKILETPETKERFAQLGMETGGGSSESFVAFLRAETAKWSKVINAAHLSIQ
jgi:tripartite-type tricarboxylate transporter receptor subunit TctC